MRKCVCCLVLVWVMLLRAVPIFAEEVATIEQLPLINVAAQKPVESSSMLDELANHPSYVVDNIVHYSTSVLYNSSWKPAADDPAPYVIIDLTVPYRIYRIDAIVKEWNASLSKSTAGTNFAVWGSTDKADWTKLYEQGSQPYTQLVGTDTSEPVLKMVVEDTTPYRYIKFDKTAGSAPFSFEIVEAMVYSAAQSNVSEVAKGKSVTINSHTGDPTLNAGNVTGRLVDGNYHQWTFAFNCDATTALTDNKLQATIDLGEPKAIRRVELIASIEGVGWGVGNADLRKNFQVCVGNTINADEEDPITYVCGTPVGTIGSDSAFGPTLGTVAFDVPGDGLYQYVIITKTEAGAPMQLADVKVYAADSTYVPETLEVTNVAAGKSVTGSGVAASLTDDSTATAWEADAAGAVIDLGAYYNVKRIGLEAANEAAKQQFEVWGCVDPENRAEDVLLAEQGSTAYAGETFSCDVGVANVVRYIRLVPKTGAAAGQQFTELSVWAGTSLENVAQGATAKGETDSASLPGNMIDGKTDGTGQTYAYCNYLTTNEKMYIDLGEPTKISALQFVSRQDAFEPYGMRNFYLVGTNDLQEAGDVLARVGKGTMPVKGSITFMVDSDQEYRYICLRKDTNVLSGGIYHPNNAQYPFAYFTDTLNTVGQRVSVSELRVFSETEAQEPAAGFSLTADPVYQKDGAPITALEAGNIRCELALANHTGEDKTFYVFIAVYDKTTHALEAVAMSEETLADGASEIVLSEDIEVTDPAAQELKVFCWDAKTLAPLLPAALFVNP